MTDSHKAILGKCYSSALRQLRDLHDEEFRFLLAEQYEQHGVTISMRMPRIRSAQKKNE